MTRASCAHCGLPAAAGDPYCCYGCELAAELTADARNDHARTHASLTVGVVLSMLVMMFALFLYAEDIYDAGADAGLLWMRTFYRWASAAVATPVMILCGVPVLKRAIRRARAGHLSMSSLIAAGAFAAYGLSLLSLARGGTKIYFDSATTALVLATLGRYLEATARAKASGIAAKSLDRALEPVAIIDDDGVTVARAAPAEIHPGMRIAVAPEQLVPVDVIAECAAEVDRAVLTGESAPISVSVGDRVPAGAVPLSSTLIGRAVTDSKSSTLAELARLAKSLREQPSRLLEIADRFARALTPIVALIALSTFAWWTQRTGVELGVVNALSVVLVACPCSYAIAAPLVHWLAMRRALASGVLIRSAEALEDLAEIEVVAFDKTGTLTDSDLRVTASFDEQTDPGEIRALIAALERDTRHPIGRALLRYAEEAAPSEIVPIAGRRLVPGRGVEAEDAAGRSLFLGRNDAGDVALVRDGVELARFELEESIRPEAIEAIEALAALGIRSIMSTGDGSERAAIVARALGLESRAGLSPEQKVDLIRGLGAPAAMVGDGINDAPALAGAVGVSMSAGAGLSRGLARVNLLRDDLKLIPLAIAIGRRARQTVLRLLIASTIYNAIFLALASAGALRPVWAGVSMLVSSLMALAVAITGMGGEPA